MSKQRNWWKRNVARSPSTRGMLVHNATTTATVLALQAWLAPLPWSTALAAFAVGACSWVLVEYVVHRWVFHRLAPRSHAKHHLAPGDARYLHGPTHVVLGTWLSALTLYPLLAGVGPGLAAVAGLNLTYALFELIHAVTHLPTCPRGLRLARQWHLLHHHADQACGHGFVSPIFDAWFGTWPAGSAVPRWLVWALPLPVPLLHFALAEAWRTWLRRRPLARA